MLHIISWKVNRLKLKYGIFIIHIKQLKSINEHYTGSYNIKYFYLFSIKEKKCYILILMRIFHWHIANGGVVLW